MKKNQIDTGIVLLKTKSITFGPFRDSLIALMEDAHWAEDYLTANRTSQVARRNFIRCTFSYFEGTIWLFKQIILEAKPPKGIRTISTGEFVLLNEVSHQLNENGEISTSPLRLKLKDNFRFTFKTINKVFKRQIDIGVGKPQWNDFLEAIKIRNRITHPKKNQDLEISDPEIKLCENTMSWFNELLASTINEFFKIEE